jgi:heat shock protein HtpX
MAVETFHTLISRNKRNSLLLIAVFTLFFVGMGLLIGAVWGGGDPAFSVAVAVIAAGVAFVWTLISFYGGTSAVLAVSHARPIEKADDPQLFNVVEELSIAAGVPMPRIYVIDDTAPNAFATGRDPAHAVVAITAGLRSKLTRDELQGVMGHELSHVRNYDIDRKSVV